MSEWSTRIKGFARTAAVQVRRAAALLATSRDRAQDLVEYGVVVAVVAVVVLAAIQAFGGGISQLFTRLLGHFSGIG